MTTWEVWLIHLKTMTKMIAAAVMTGAAATIAGAGMTVEVATIANAVR